jgi:ABC-type sugar transport system permease subunit
MMKEGNLEKVTFKEKVSNLFKRFKEFRRRNDNSTLAQKSAKNGYLFILPWIFGFFGLVLYPFIRIIYMSLNNVTIVEQSYNYEWVGFDNFRRILFEDIDFVLEVQNFVVRVFLYTPVIIALAVIIAMLLNQQIKGKAIFRMIFFLPIIILNGELLENMAQYGGMDINLSPFVLDIITTIVPFRVLGLFIELFSIIIEILWYSGVPILIFLAMLQKVDRSLYEAAAIDGANSWSTFWKITFPALRPAISVSIIFIVVFLANFDGNPINAIILSSKQDGSRRDGYASAMALIYSVIQIAVISLLFFITREREKVRR